jgi:hypothetical protein
LFRAILSGAAFAILMSLPIALLTVVVFRFPIPFGEYESGIAAVPRTILAVAFYGMLGGFPLLGFLGAGAGLWAWRRHAPDGRGVLRLTLILASVAALAGVLTLAVLDMIIGPW